MANDNAQGAKPFSPASISAEMKGPMALSEKPEQAGQREQPDAPPPTDGPDNKFAYPFGVDNDEGSIPGAPGPTAASPLDPAIAPNKFPRQSGSDTYSGIPGDGIVEG